MKNQANALIKKLKENGKTLALAESVTCGLAAHKLSGCKGVSDVLKASIVCYTPEVKNKLMHVSKKAIQEYTCESMEVTETLACNLSKLVDADVYAAVTGLASEGGSETKSKPVGTVFFCVKWKERIFKQKKLFRGAPHEIKEKSCLALYDFILSSVKNI
jgi:nicotinamide-nucleotide amidase